MITIPCLKLSSLYTICMYFTALGFNIIFRDKSYGLWFLMPISTTFQVFLLKSYINAREHRRNNKKNGNPVTLASLGYTMHRTKTSKTKHTLLYANKHRSWYSVNCRGIVRWNKFTITNSSEHFYPQNTSSYLFICCIAV
jgi:hypothetical protein